MEFKMVVPDVLKYRISPDMRSIKECIMEEVGSCELVVEQQVMVAPKFHLSSTSSVEVFKSEVKDLPVV
jgi:hypothetical protein